MLWGCLDRHPHLFGCENLLFSHFTKTCYCKKYMRFVIVVFNFRYIFLMFLFIYLPFYLCIYVTTKEGEGKKESKELPLTLLSI